MKLTDYARELGVTRQTANRWFHEGKIPGAYQLDTGTIIVPNNIFESHKKNQGKTIIYARVSSSEQRKTNLETQAQRLIDFSIANGWQIDEVIKEVGSGLNDERPKLTKILTSDEPIKRIVVEHKDRLSRFGFNYIEILAKTKNFEIIVVNQVDSDKEDLIQDFISIITSFCARIYSKRRVTRKTEQLIEELKNETNRNSSN